MASSLLSVRVSAKIGYQNCFLFFSVFCGKSALSVDDNLKIIACREQKQTLAAPEMELSAARQEDFVSKNPKHTDGGQTKRRPLVVIRIMTTLGNKKKRDVVRQNPWDFSYIVIAL